MRRSLPVLVLLLLQSCSSDFPVKDNDSTDKGDTVYVICNPCTSSIHAYDEFYTNSYIGPAFHYIGSDRVYVKLSYLRVESYSDVSLTTAFYLNDVRLPVLDTDYGGESDYNNIGYLLSLDGYTSTMAVHAGDSIICHAIYLDEEHNLVKFDTCTAGITMQPQTYLDTAWNNFDSLRYDIDSIIHTVTYQQSSNGSQSLRLYMYTQYLLPDICPHIVVGIFSTPDGTIIHQERELDYTVDYSTSYWLSNAETLPDTIVFNGYILSNDLNARVTSIYSPLRILLKKAGD